MYIKGPAGFFWLVVHSHQESFPSVTAKMVYTVVDPRGTRKTRALYKRAATVSPCPEEVTVYMHQEW